MTPILQVRKWVLRELKGFLQSHPGCGKRGTRTPGQLVSLGHYSCLLWWPRKGGRTVQSLGLWLCDLWQVTSETQFPHQIYDNIVMVLFLELNEKRKHYASRKGSMSDRYCCWCYYTLIKLNWREESEEGSRGSLPANMSSPAHLVSPLFLR